MPGTIRSFAILQFEDLSDFIRKLEGLPHIDVLTLDLEEVEGAGGRAVTDKVHARCSDGRCTRVVCYTSSGYEGYRKDAHLFPASAKGGEICKDSACKERWPDEAWGDIRKPELLEFLGRRAARARQAACDAIEFDNMDQAFNETDHHGTRRDPARFTMTPDENLQGALQLARLGHEHGLAVMAKNASELATDLAAHFDGVFVESCEQKNECDAYLPYEGKLVATVEYDSACKTRHWAACNRQHGYFDEHPRR